MNTFIAHMTGALLIISCAGCTVLPAGGAVEVQLIDRDAPARLGTPSGLILPYYDVRRNTGLISSQHYQAFDGATAVTADRQVVSYPSKSGGGLFIGWPLSFATKFYCEMLVLVDGYWPKPVLQYTVTNQERKLPNKTCIYFNKEDPRKDRLRARRSPQDDDLADTIPEGLTGLAKCYLHRKEVHIPPYDLVKLAQKWPGIRQALAQLEPARRQAVHQEILAFCETGLRQSGDAWLLDKLRSIADECRGTMPSPEK